MALQTLRYADQLLAGFPDNVTGLISAENVRDFLVSILPGRGLLEETDNIALAIVADTWLSINPLLTNPDHTEMYWNFDGNNFAYPNHSGHGMTVPAGYSKSAQLLSILELSKSAGGSDAYEVQFTKNGVGIGQPESVEFPAAGVNTVTLLHPLLVDVSVPTDLYGVQIRGDGTSVDLILGYFTLQISDAIRLEAPTP